MGLMPGWVMDQALKPDPREEKLPKYARETLRVLRASLTEQRELATDALRRTDPAGSLVVLNPYDDNDGVGLGNRATVRFKTGVGYIDVNLRDDWVNVTAGNGLEVRPVVSNSINVRDTPRWGTR